MYISPVDILGISVDELMNLDERGLIRLEKRLKIQQLQKKDDAYNPQQYDQLLTQLADVEKKKSIYFIEKHPHLKKFISTGEDDGVKTFSIDQKLLNDAPHINAFLAPYFDAYFMRLVKRDYGKRRYDTLLRAMNFKELFTSQLLTTYYEYIKAQIEIVIERIVVAKKGKLIENCPEIRYKSFVELMNTVPLGFIRKTKLHYVNAMVDYYNSTLNTYGEFSKVQLVFSNFPHIEIGDQDLTAYFKKLSRQIAGTSSIRNNNKKSESSSSGWQIIFLIFGIVIFVVRMSRIFNSSSTYNAPNSSTNYNLPSFVVEYDEDKTAFYSDLIHKASGDAIVNEEATGLVRFQNAYSFQFKPIAIKSVQKNERLLKIENNRVRSLILFLQENPVVRENKSISMLGGDAVEIPGIVAHSAIVFYAGNDFVTVKQQNRITINSGNFKIKPSKHYFKDVSEVELEWLKYKFVVDSVGTDPKITLLENELVFHNIYMHQEAHKLLPPEPVEKVFGVTDSNIETNKNWKAEKQLFFNQLKKGVLLRKDTLIIQNGDNPYPSSFKSINHVSISGYEVPLTNTSDEDVIVFSRNLTFDRDQAVYLKSKGSVQLHLHDANDTLYFYKGRHFQKYELPASNALRNTVTPEGYFGKFSKANHKLFKQYYAIQELGADPEIELNNQGVILKDIEFHTAEKTNK